MTYVLALLSIIIISLVLTDIASGVCVNNLSYRAIHVEINNRGGGLFNKGFSKKVKPHGKECCDAGNSDCWSGTAEDALYWLNCDEDKKGSSAQVIVACSNCNINVDDAGLIAVAKEKTPDLPIAVYACKVTS